MYVYGYAQMPGIVVRQLVTVRERSVSGAYIHIQRYLTKTT